MAWEDFARQQAEEVAHRIPYQAAYQKMDKYGRFLTVGEAVNEDAWKYTGKVGVPALAGYGMYSAYGLGGLAVAGGLYGAKKGLDFARHAYSQGHADRVFSRLENSRGAKDARKMADAAYRRASKNFKFHPSYWARKGIAGTARGIGKGLMAAGRGIISAAPGVAAGAGLVGMKIARGAWDVARVGEAVARTALTGGLAGTPKGMSAWFPYYNKLPKGDFRKFAMNPKVGNRLAAGAVVLGLISGASDLLTQRYHGPPATVYYDGVSTHHIDEMGANAEYAQKILGSNSAYARSLAPVADDAALLLARAALLR